MTIQDIGLMQAIGAKMDYLNQRQTLIAQNVANADTPGYRPKDLVDVNFADMLREQTRPSVETVPVQATNVSHITSGSETGTANARKTREPYEVAPAGNSVIIEEQLVNAGQNAMDYNLMLNLMQKQVGMFRTALGSNR